jgi:hypothetical protein
MEGLEQLWVSIRLVRASIFFCPIFDSAVMTQITLNVFTQMAANWELFNPYAMLISIRISEIKCPDVTVCV